MDVLTRMYIGIFILIYIADCTFTNDTKQSISISACIECGYHTIFGDTRLDIGCMQEALGFRTKYLQVFLYGNLYCRKHTFLFGVDQWSSILKNQKIFSLYNTHVTSTYHVKYSHFLMYSGTLISINVIAHSVRILIEKCHIDDTVQWSYEIWVDYT